MVTAAWVFWFLNALNITINIRNVCVLLAPWFASNTTLVAYFMGKEVKNSGTGLVAAALIAIIPGYISRSVAGSFDNEGIAIFALLLTYAMWLRAVNSGSIFWAAVTTLAYFYMVAAWGGYIFIINLIPLYTFVMLLSGRFSTRLYVAYCTFYTIGTMLSMQITFVGFQAVQSSEHMAAFGIFGLLQLMGALNWIRSLLSADSYRRFFRTAILSGVVLFVLAFGIGTATGYISPWTGRFYSLLDPTYAKENIPIIASVSEHQPTTWASFFFDLHLVAFMMPVGLYYSFKHLTDANIFLICYGVTSVYFAGVMVRLMLVLAPIACMLAAIGISSTLELYMRPLKPRKAAAAAPASSSATSAAATTVSKRDLVSYPAQYEVSLAVVFGMSLLLIAFTWHCIWVTSEAYSSPSIVLAAKQPDGSKRYFDDFREAYRWLNFNTAPDARVMSWWDYGYQISAMANRTILVDNNTWNNSHIAQVGKAMSGTEEVAIKIMRNLDVDYVLVIFGGLTGYASDDVRERD
jgi:dolichyl-diphosphooligosaccharide--protein glycosyltransferase